MDIIKRVKAGFFILLILFSGITTLASKAVFARSKDTGNHMELQAECRNAAVNRITDSTGNYEYIILEDGTAEIIQYLKEERTVKIPAVLDGHTVTGIGTAFWHKPSVVNIEIPDTVTHIGSFAFWNTGIKQITIPESTIRIEFAAFGGCPHLERIYIPWNVKKVEGNITYASENLTNIEVDFRNATYTSVDGVLYDKDVTELLIMPGGKDMAGFKIPESVVCIGHGAFHGYESASFTELVIPDRITTLKPVAFGSCRTLKRVVMGENVSIIGSQAFAGCDSLSEVILNEKLKVIEKRAFYECHDLVKINIPDSVREIGDSAFQNCGNLKKITIPKSVTKIGTYAFAYFEDGTAYEDVCITGYKNTAAHRYAKSHWVTFRDAESGKVIRYDLLPVPKEKIKKLTAGVKKIRLVYQAVPDAAYQVAVKKTGAPAWKKYDRQKASAEVKGLASGRQYRVRVRTLYKFGGKYYYGKWSSVKKIKVR